jgi:hypothetical protein
VEVVVQNLQSLAEAGALSCPLEVVAVEEERTLLKMAVEVVH